MHFLLLPRSRTLKLSPLFTRRSPLGGSARFGFNQFLHSLKILLHFFSRFWRDQRLEQPRQKPNISCLHLKVELRFSAFSGRSVIASLRETIVRVPDRRH